MPSFRKTRSYGFEMVDAPARCNGMRERHQSKIYAESNRSAFLRIFREFGSMQTLAVYRRGLRKVSIARSIATNEKNIRGRDMFFLLRMAFWLGLVLVLLPREKSPES